MSEETLTKSVKKVIRWGKGLAIFITKEAKTFKWDDKTYVTVAAVKDGNVEKIVIRKAHVSD